MRVVIAGGGTAGHVFPALALGQALVAEHGADVRFLGTATGLESRLVPAAGFSFTAVEAQPLERKLSLASLAAPVTAVRSIAACASLVRAADVVVGVGGYVSVPAVLAAWRAKRPVVLHEQNAVPGLANRLLARRANVACVSFAESAALLPRRTPTVVTGNPVRREILAVPGAREALASAAFGELDLDSSRRTALIFGGSQGALRIDHAVIGAMELLRDRADLQLLVLTGPAHLADVAAAARRMPALLVRAIPFLQRMDLAYAAADVVVARAGATTIAEVTVCGLPSILVPYPHATANHQEANARVVERAGASTIVPDRVLTPELLARRMTALLDDEPGLVRMGRCASAWSRPDATTSLAEQVVGAVKETPRRSGRPPVDPGPYRPPDGSIPTLEVPALDGMRRVHMIGIGGAGMSGIARLLLARGVLVTGSDLKESPPLDELRGMGATIFVGHASDQVGHPDAVVVSTAIPRGNPELLAARERGLHVLARAQMLAGLARGRRTLAVAGTHGKTTTTSMLSVILQRAGIDASYVIGGHLNESGSGAHHGRSDVLVAEADESDGSFLLLRPEVGIITNVEVDHLDFYPGGLEEIEAAFAAFARASTAVVACGDDRGATAALERAGVDAVSYGTGEHNRVRVRAEAPTPSGARGLVVLEDDERVPLALRIAGVHNLLNAAAALLAARRVGVAPADAAAGLAAFTGVHRRFERRGEARGATFVDDYAHHPTELRVTLAAAAGLRPSRVIAVFQPHRFSRTRELWRELGESLATADLVVVTDVYAAGEEPIPGISGRLLVDALEAAAPGTRVVYLPHRSDIAPFLAEEVRDGDLVLTLGAGDITAVVDEALDRIGEGA